MEFKEIEILKELVGEGKVVHTHASAVLITDEYVYKIKKPVDFGFLNYTQLKQRKMYSYLEKELNERYSRDIYLEVLKIAKRDGKNVLVPAENTLPTMEYVLKMRRIPDNEFLSSLIDQGKVDCGYMEELGGQIATRLVCAEPSPEIVDGMAPYDLIKFNCDENFTQLNEIAKDRLDFRFDYIKRITESYLNDNKELFLDRYTKGFVKNGHGDLRLEHVYIKDGYLGLIDCIEFNKRFRTNDVVNEAAFLSMEMDYANMGELADAFLAGFFSVVNDADSVKLLNFYRCYRAVVRAKVAIFTMMSYKPEDDVYAEKVNEFERMMDMAFMYAKSTESMRPLVFCGMIASGKSVNADAFACIYPVSKVSSDIMRKLAAGMKENESGVAPVGEGLYTDEGHINTYTLMGEKVAEKMKVGRLSIVDATGLKKRYLDAFESRFAEKPVYIEFVVPDDVAIERLKNRVGQQEVSDGRLHHFEDMKTGRDELHRDLLLDGEEKSAVNVRKISEFIIK